MAFGAVITAPPPPLPLPCTTLSSSSSSCRLPRGGGGPSSTRKGEVQFRPIFLSSSTTNATAATVSLFASLFVLVPPNEADALTISKDQIITSVTQVENTIDQVVDVGSGVFDVSQRFLQLVIDALKPALPLLQKAGDQALQIATPAISDASNKAQQALQSSGFDIQPLLTAAKTVTGAAQQTTKAIEVAKPIASSTMETIFSADPTVIVGTAGAVFLSSFLFPPIWSAISFNLRGYKGMLTPAQTLDLMSTQNYFMVDIRSEKDKNKAGIPRLPSSATSKMISIPLEELPVKIKKIVRNTKKVEAEIAALKISYLKKVGKGCNIVIMDSYSDTAKIVARALTNLGFKNCWIVADGFSGSRGWIQSRLGTDSYNLSFAEVLSPSRFIPAARSFRTTGSTSLQSSRKFLPGSSE